jgi:hypothetical protein
MDKLEQYLDQVCRGIGGPVEMRQHVRQELREHLLDAVAQHKAAGFSAEQSLDKALEEFGKPDEMRSDLEAAHGQRMTWVLDKAMQWKERTMKAKWLWMTWAFLALAVVIALEVFFITMAVVFLVPKFQHLLRFGYIDAAEVEQAGAGWMLSFLEHLMAVAGGYTTWLLLLAFATVGLFEWRVKSDNKPFIRLSALGTAAVGLMVVVVLTGGSMVIPYLLGAPGPHLARPFAVDQVAKIDTSVGALEKALAKKDWKAMQEHADRASQTLANLAKAGPALPVLANWNMPRTVAQQDQAIEEIRANGKAASEALAEAQQAIGAQDAARLETELQKFRKSFEPLRLAAKRPRR